MKPSLWNQSGCFLFDLVDAIGLRYGIFKNRQPWGIEGKGHKNQNDQKAQAQGSLTVVRFGEGIKMQGHDLAQ